MNELKVYFDEGLDSTKQLFGLVVTVVEKPNDLEATILEFIHTINLSSAIHVSGEKKRIRSGEIQYLYFSDDINTMI
jgi:hypothetical protein